jgi:hypothetical protein
LYRIAARRFVAEMHPSRVAVIGIRGSGTTSSRVVEAELQRLGVSTRSWTVRPAGIPGDLQLDASEELEQIWREWDGWFAVVGAGPGLTGSSFGAVASFLANERIVLFPSWRATARLSRTARDAEHARVPRGVRRVGAVPGSRPSAGKWRRSPESGPPRTAARAPQVPSATVSTFVAGRRLGDPGTRAKSVGWIPEALSVQHGFLESRWVPAGLPLPVRRWWTPPAISPRSGTVSPPVRTPTRGR